MIDHVPVLLIVLPIVAGALPLLAGLVSDRAGWPIAVLAMVGQTGLAGWLGYAVGAAQSERSSP